MKMAKIAAVCALVMVLSGWGCTRYSVNEGTFAPTQIRDPNLPGTQIRLNSVSVLDRSIANKVFVEGSGSSRTATNTLQVWSTFRNRTDYPLQLEVRVSFYDAAQAPMDGPTQWQRIQLPGNGTAHFKDFSTKVNIGYYHVEVREGR